MSTNLDMEKERMITRIRESSVVEFIEKYYPEDIPCEDCIADSYCDSAFGGNTPKECGSSCLKTKIEYLEMTFTE